MAAILPYLVTVTSVNAAVAASAARAGSRSPFCRGRPRLPMRCSGSTERRRRAAHQPRGAGLPAPSAAGLRPEPATETAKLRRTSFHLARRLRQQLRPQPEGRSARREPVSRPARSRCTASSCGGVIQCPPVRMHGDQQPSGHRLRHRDAWWCRCRSSDETAVRGYRL